MSYSPTHWVDWHRAYDEEGSTLQRRLGVVEAELRAALDAMPPGPISLLSLCSGDGRDVLDVLAAHERAADVRALLVDLDETLLGAGARRAERLGLGGVAVLRADAGVPAPYRAVLPVDVLVFCGILGNVSDEDASRSVAAFSSMLRERGHVLWTRHRRAPDLTVRIRRWLAASGFEERSFVPIEGTLAAVGHHVLAAPADSRPPEVLFRFEGDGTGATW